MSGAVSSHCHGHIDNLQLLDREATLLGTGKCPLYNYDSGMNRASRSKSNRQVVLLVRFFGSVFSVTVLPPTLMVTDSSMIESGEVTR